MIKFVDQELPTGAARIDGQYFLGGSLVWTNLNAIIWQQIATIIAIQSGALTAGYAIKPSLVSIGILLFGMILTLVIGVHITRNIAMRRRVLSHMTLLSKTLMPKFKRR